MHVTPRIHGVVKACAVIGAELRVIPIQFPL
jgi:hypothetical protein